MARLNITVPDDLKAKMDELTDVNWSATAAKAFWDVVLKRSFKGDDMSNVVERLKASKARYEEKLVAEGKALGAKWASFHAGYGELLNLSKYEFENWDFDELADALDLSDFTYLADFYEIVAGGENPSKMKRKFDEPEFTEAFIKGALEVFESVSEKLS